MSSPHALSADSQQIQMIDPDNTETLPQLDRIDGERTNQVLFSPITKIPWTQRVKNYFTTHDGRITLSNLSFTLICVILQHVMGTCHHHVTDGTNLVKWHVFTPPFGAGPHTAVFFFVLSWTTLAYCIERIWVYLTTGARVSKRRDLFVHGIIVILYLAALAFNIWGYVLCESTSQVNRSEAFAPGVCRGDSQACIPLVAGIMASCAAACAFFSEHILALTKILRGRRESNDATSTPRILP